MSVFLRVAREARGLPLVPRAVYLDDIVADATRALNVLARERETHRRGSRDTEVASSATRRLLRQLIRNLLDNAVRHAKSGERHRELHQAPSASRFGGDDDGEGVPDAQRKRIFADSFGSDPHIPELDWACRIRAMDAERTEATMVLESSGSTGRVFTVTLPAAVAILQIETEPGGLKPEAVHCGYRRGKWSYSRGTAFLNLLPDFRLRQARHSSAFIKATA